MDEEIYYLEQTTDGIILADVSKKRLCYWNKVSVAMYGIDEKTYSLEDIFQFAPLTLDEMIVAFLQGYSEENPVGFYENICTTSQTGEDQFVDFTIGYYNPERSKLFFNFHFRADRRDEIAKQLVYHGVTAVFLAELEEDLPIYYGNEKFYTIFTKGQEGFESFYKNCFFNTLIDVQTEDLFVRLRRELQFKNEFSMDVQVSTTYGVRKWFLLKLTLMTVGRNKTKVKGILIPIADRIEATQQLELLNQYFQGIQELTTGALFYVNPRTKRAKHHSKLLKEHGFPDEMDHFPQCILPMIHPEEGEKFLAYGEKVLKGEREKHILRYRVGKDTYSWAKMDTLPIWNDKGEIIEIIGRIENMDDELDLLNRATVDPLTGALNKEFVRDTISGILNGSSGGELRHALFFLDLDNFKYVNDNLGHKFGDYLLGELGIRMGRCVRSGDVIGRVGGDEFVLLIRNIPNMNILMKKSLQLLETIGEEFNDGNITHKIGGSIGVAVFPDHGTDYDVLYEHADLALYRSKHRGKNMATIYRKEFSV